VNDTVTTLADPNGTNGNQDTKGSRTNSNADGTASRDFVLAVMVFLLGRSRDRGRGNVGEHGAGPQHLRRTGVFVGEVAKETLHLSTVGNDGIGENVPGHKFVAGHHGDGPRIVVVVGSEVAVENGQINLRKNECVILGIHGIGSRRNIDGFRPVLEENRRGLVLFVRGSTFDEMKAEDGQRAIIAIGVEVAGAVRRVGGRADVFVDAHKVEFQGVVATIDGVFGNAVHVNIDEKVLFPRQTKP